MINHVRKLDERSLCSTLIAMSIVLEKLGLYVLIHTESWRSIA